MTLPTLQEINPHDGLDRRFEALRTAFLRLCQEAKNR